MPRSLIPLQVDDISNFAKSLSTQLKSTPDAPGHVALLNMLARAAGFRNFQHLRAGMDPEIEETQVNQKRIEKTLREFDDQGRMKRWPTKRAVQDLSLWAFWAKLPPHISMTEKQVNEVLNDWHVFKDPAILRRSLVTVGLVTRQIDGSDYRRVERKPDAEGQAFLTGLQMFRARNNAGVRG